MVFTEQEIRRLQELASWGIRRGITDEDLKSAEKKLVHLRCLHESVSVVTEDPDHPYNGEPPVNTIEKSVSFVEKLIGRAVTPNETHYLQKFIDRGAGYEQIRYALLEAVKAMGGPNLVYAEKVLEKEMLR